MAKKSQTAVAEPIVEEPITIAEIKAKKAKKDKPEVTALNVAITESFDMPSTSDWQDMLDDLGNESNDPRIYYVKAGRNRIKLAPEGGDPKKFFTKVTRSFRGQISTKFLIRALVMKGKSEEPPKVQAIPVGKSVMKDILNLLAEGYDLFNVKTGKGLTIVKTGTGLTDTSYTVLPSPSAVPMPKTFTDLEDTLASLAEYLTAQDQEREERNDKNGPAGNRGVRNAAASLGGQSKVADDNWD